MSDVKEAEFSMNVMINKDKTKVLFAEADSHFVDILLSFLTLPLGRILKLLEKHYGDEAPAIGSLSSLYHGLANLDNAHFWTEGARQTMLNPTSSFEAEYERLKLNITDSQPPEYFACGDSNCSHRFRSDISVYYDMSVYFDKVNIHICTRCRKYYMNKVVAEKGPKAACSDGVFTIRTSSFIISDDLQILPNGTELLKVFSILGITDTVKAEPTKVTFGLSEIMSLLKASLTSETPLSDLIVNKTRHANSVTVDSEAETSLNHIENEENPESKKMILKVVTQKSTGKLLYAKAKEDFVEFLFCLLHIPLGGVEHLLSGKTCFKAINNLYQSTTDLIDDEYFKTPDTKNRLMKPNLVHGCISKDYILPLVEESLPAADFSDLSRFSSVKFPKGQGSYVEGPRIYQVTDDLTVTPYCFVSIFSSLSKQNIPISDVKEVELQIGLKEALSILRASLTSTSVLTDALLNHISIKQPKPEEIAA